MEKFIAAQQFKPVLRHCILFHSAASGPKASCLIRLPLAEAGRQPPCGRPGSRLQPGPAPILEGFWGIRRQKKVPSLCLSSRQKQSLNNEMKCSNISEKPTRFKKKYLSERQRNRDRCQPPLIHWYHPQLGLSQAGATSLDPRRQLGFVT